MLPLVIIFIIILLCNSFNLTDLLFVSGRTLLKEKQALLDTGYSKCDEYIRLLTIGQLPCLPGCNEEESLESKILKGLLTYHILNC